MYFILSSLLSFVCNPVFYIIVCLVLAWLVKNRIVKKVLYGVNIVLVILFTNQPFSRFVKEQWYKEYDHPLPAGKVYQYGIVLGGYSNWDWERNRVEFSEIADRLLAGIYLYKQGIVKKLVLASDGSIIENPTGQGPKGNPRGMMAFLRAMGMPEHDVILEVKARNTRENVTRTLELLGDSLRTSPSLLITSAVHMRRSLSAFQAEGLHPDYYITDTQVRIDGEGDSWMPSLQTLSEWPELLHEWIGYLVYKVKGW